MISLKFEHQIYYPYYLKTENGVRYMILSQRRGLRLTKKSVSFFDFKEMKKEEREYMCESSHISFQEWSKNLQFLIQKFCDISESNYVKKYFLSPYRVYNSTSIFSISYEELIIEGFYEDFIQEATLINENFLNEIKQHLIEFAKYTFFPKRFNRKEYKP